MKKKFLSKACLLKKYDRLRNALRKKFVHRRIYREDLFTLFKNVSNGIFIVDLKGRITFFNNEVQRISGYGEKEILKSHFRMLLSLDDLADGFKLFYDAVHGVYPQSILLRIRKKDGSTTIAEMQVAPFHLDGELHGVVAFMRDNSERKKLEQANRERVETFIRLSNDLDEWQKEVTALRREVNELLHALGRDEKYPLPE